jgi:hypothetical protein
MAVVVVVTGVVVLESSDEIVKSEDEVTVETVLVIGDKMLVRSRAELAVILTGKVVFTSCTVVLTTGMMGTV